MLDLEPAEVLVRPVSGKYHVCPQIPPSSYIDLIFTNLLLSFITNIPE
jgi:hypothetical protein